MKKSREKATPGTCDQKLAKKIGFDDPLVIGGILNYEMDQRRTHAAFVRVKCHLVFGNRPLPVSHPAALPKV